MMRSRLFLCGAALALVLAPAHATSPDQAELNAWAEALAACADCHEDHMAVETRGPHAAVEGSCASCHGDPTAHYESGGEAGNIFAFKDDDPSVARSTVCLDCHGAAHPTFMASAHAGAGLSCDTCHDTHTDPLRPALIDNDLILPIAGAADLPPGAASCAGCHSDVMASFAFTERHRLQEGVMTCVTCHEPHARSQRARLGGFKQEACETCHADKAGPFVFEHGSQRVEGCVACHAPHGAPNRHLLSFQRVAELCYSCHVVVPGFHTRFTADTQCTNCHSTIHGSNFDAAFLK